MKLTPQQMAEAVRHQIPLSMIFDATGLTRQQAIKAMAETKESVMINGLPCRNDQTHVLRTRHGHCVECNPAAIAFQGRMSQRGSTYLAGSKKTGLFKIGMSIDPQRREATINSLCYGGASDWQILAVVESEQCGLIEYDTQRILAAHHVEASYLKEGRQQACFEVFRCAHRVALAALKHASSQHDGKMILELQPDGRFGTGESYGKLAVPAPAATVPAENEIYDNSPPTGFKRAGTGRAPQKAIVYFALVGCAFVAASQFMSALDAAVLTVSVAGPLVIALWAFLSHFKGRRAGWLFGLPKAHLRKR